MKKIYSFALVLLVGAASLSSCSRANYVFDSKVPAYPAADQVAAQIPMAPEVTVKTEVLPMADNQAIALALPAAAAAATTKALAKSTAEVARPSLAQRLLVKRVTKQLRKVAHSQNTARAAHTASDTGRAGLVILAGLIILLIGGLIGGLNFVSTIGGVLFLIGLVLLVIALIRK